MSLYKYIVYIKIPYKSQLYNQCKLLLFLKASQEQVYFHSQCILLAKARAILMSIWSMWLYMLRKKGCVLGLMTYYGNFETFNKNWTKGPHIFIFYWAPQIMDLSKQVTRPAQILENGREVRNHTDR